MCACTFGAAPSALTVDSQTILKINGMLVATIQDMAPDDNVMPFGICEQLTTEAEGVPTPCVPAINAPWAPGSTLTKINDLPVLLQSDKLLCDVGGEISITDPANALFETD